MLHPDKGFIGSVYFNASGYEKEEIRSELRKMRSLGFNMVRFYHAIPRYTKDGWDFSRTDDWIQCIEEEEIYLFWHLEWFYPTAEELQAHGLSLESLRHADPESSSYQQFLRNHYGPLIERYRDHPWVYAWGVHGEPHPAQDYLEVEDRGPFAQWLRLRYTEVRALNEAWYPHPLPSKPEVKSFETAWVALEGFKAKEEISGVNRAMRNYGAARDMIEFLEEKSRRASRRLISLIKEISPDKPVVIGSHQLLANQPAHRWNHTRWARECDIFSTSIHIPWHFELTNGEIDRPALMQAKLTRDYKKDGVTTAYETTGGSVQYSGGYGVGMTPGLMERLFLSYLAAGHTRVAFWTWNPRPAGWEAGEYGLIQLDGEIAPHGKTAGEIAQALDRWVDELATARHGPKVAILESWDTDAILTLEPQRHDLQEGPRWARGTEQQAVRARVGTARALLNAHIPFDYLTADELVENEGSEYPCLIVPHARALSNKVLEILMHYVERGGVLLADVQFGFLDAHGKIRFADQNDLRKKLFGATITNIHDSATCPRRVNDQAIEGFFGDLKLCGPNTRILARFDDGKPAITCLKHGKGKSILAGFDLSRECLNPGNKEFEQLIVSLLGDRVVSNWKCTAPLAWRRRGEGVDHYFLFNDQGAKTYFLSMSDGAVELVDAVTGEELGEGDWFSIEMEAGSARWFRAVASS